jgi:hypothetical protein
MPRTRTSARRSPLLKTSVEDLRLRGEVVPIHRVFQRVIHPGLTPLEGNGFVAAQPLGRIDLPGSWTQCVALLHWFERGQLGNPLAETFARYGCDRMPATSGKIPSARMCGV